MKNTLSFLVTSLAACGITSAAITVHGSSTNYTETGGDWQTSIVNDIDNGVGSSTGLGTDGYIFYGQFDGVNTGGGNNHNYAGGTAGGSTSLPSYISSHGAGLNFTAIADEFTGYGSIDDPNFTDGTNTLGGFALATGGAAGASREIMTFTISGLPANTTLRLGLLGGVESNGDGRWDSTSFTVSDGTASASVGDHTTSPLPANPGGSNTGWAFFDIDTDGVYTVSGTKRLAGQGAGLAGLTFDTLTVPEPSTSLLAGLAGLALTLRRRR